MNLNLSPIGKHKMTDRQRMWYERYMECGNASQACRSMGIEKNVNRVGHEYKKVLLPYILRDMHKLIGRCVPDALETIYEIAQSCPDPKVKLAAAQDILNRAGFKQSKKVEVSVKDKSNIDLDKEIEKLLKKGNVVDAELVEGE